jgi:hypothetical protein
VKNIRPGPRLRKMFLALSLGVNIAASGPLNADRRTKDSESKEHSMLNSLKKVFFEKENFFFDERETRLSQMHRFHMGTIQIWREQKEVLLHL